MSNSRSICQLMVFTGEEYRKATKREVMEVAAEYSYAKLQGVELTSPNISRSYLIQARGGAESEAFGVVFMNSRHRVIRTEEMFQGTVDGASVHPREVVKRALELNATAVILFHNHPSGDPNPSQADELITYRLKDALALVDIRVLDHMIIAGDKVTSLAEKGLI